MTKQKSTPAATTDKPNNPANEISPLEYERFRHIDGVEITLATLEAIRDASESLENALELLRLSKDPTFIKAATVLEPIAEIFSTEIRMSFPDLDWIRRDLIRRGFGSQILGGALYDEAEIMAEAGLQSKRLES